MRSLAILGVVDGLFVLVLAVLALALNLSGRQRIVMLVIGAPIHVAYGAAFLVTGWRRIVLASADVRDALRYWLINAIVMSVAALALVVVIGTAIEGNPPSASDMPLVLLICTGPAFVATLVRVLAAKAISRSDASRSGTGRQGPLATD
jgi:hypothetical protein